MFLLLPLLLIARSASGDVPEVPTQVSATVGVFKDRVDVRWRSSDFSADSFRVYRNDRDHPATATLISGPVGRQPFADRSIEPGQNYFYWVTAVGEDGESGLGSSAVGRTGGGQALAEARDDFDEPKRGPIDGKGGGTGFAGPWRITEANGSAETSDGSLALKRGAEDEPLILERDLDGRVGESGTVTWLRFSFRAEENEGRPFYVGFNGHRDSSVGMVDGDLLGIHGQNSSFRVTPGRSYLLVARYQHAKGNDTLDLWIDPRLDDDQAFTDLPPSATRDNVNPPLSSRLHVRVEGRSSGDFRLDEIRVGSTLGSVLDGFERDVKPPQPEPILFASAPTGVGPGELEMRSAEAADPSGVQYYFESRTKGGHDSGWQDSPKYVDLGLLPNKKYGYRIRTRDLSPRSNESRWSRPIFGVTSQDAVAVENAPEGRKRPEIDEALSKLQGRVNEAIDRGVEALLTQQERDGSWRSHSDGYRTGMTALALYTLAKSKVPQNHPSIQRALSFLRAQPLARKTYSAGVTILALSALDAKKHAKWIKSLAERLIAWQLQDGYSYPDGAKDLSNTQYAALGLWMAANQGVKVPRETWEGLAEYALSCQEPAKGAYAPAGFRYRPTDDATGSMTAAGVTILLICEQQLGRKQSTSVGRDRGVAWLARHFSVDSNPRPAQLALGKGPHTGRLYYYLYGLERVGSILDETHIGGHDWYREGAEFLVDKQEGNGRWASQHETSFAVLFLNRATSVGTGAHVRGGRTFGETDAAKDLSLLATGDTPLTLWISGYGDDARFEFEWDDEEGKGPRVAKVQYLVEDEAAPEGEVVLVEVKGHRDRPTGAERYAVQHSFARPGVMRVFARAFCVPPEWDEEWTDEDLVELESDVLEIPVHAARDAELLRYASDFKQTLIDPAKAQITTSTFQENHGPEKACDGLTSSEWRAEKTDQKPWIQVEFRRAVSANVVLLSPIWRASDETPEKHARPTRVTVSINGKQSYDVEMNADPMRKTELLLPARAKVRRLKVTITETNEGPDHPVQGIGLAELELHKRR